MILQVLMLGISLLCILGQVSGTCPNKHDSTSTIQQVLMYFSIPTWYVGWDKSSKHDSASSHV